METDSKTRNWLRSEIRRIPEIDEAVDEEVAVPEIGEFSSCFRNDLGFQATAIVVLLDVSGASAVSSCSDTNMRVSMI